MKKIINILAGICAYAICAILYLGYGHTETHVPLNTSIGLRFLEMANGNAFNDKTKFKNYEFNWNNDQQPKLIGPAITKDYYTSYSESDEVDLGYTPLEWISKGGWMEDEPWGPASICHFYDPKGIDGGKKYLTDNSGKVEWLVSIPKTWYTRDAKSWVTGTENRYGWRKAKEYVVLALQEMNVAIKNNYMAKAYRCLGQSLHLVADMGCPPHVRNDSHPPKVSFLVGDPDPYEDICKKLDTYTLVKASAPNPSLKTKVSGTQKFEDIFESLAVFTNEKFYSGGTISTDRYKPKIRSNNPYPNPLMGESDYNNSEFTYYKTYEGNVKVKMCKDKVPVPYSFIFGKDSTRGRPYLDYDCVESMASALMPNVVEAGANVIRLFVPSLKMEITEAKPDSGGIIRGKVSYTLPSADDEYFGLFNSDDLYNGPVSLFINGNDTKIKVNAKKNKFEFKLDGKVKDLKKDDIALTKLEFGGIVLKSDEKKVGTSDILNWIKTKKFVAINFDATATFSNKEEHCISEGDGCPGEYLSNYDYDKNSYTTINWNGGDFSLTHNYTVPPLYGNYSSSFTLSGSIQDDGTITNIVLNFKDNSGWEYYFKVEGIKVTRIFRDENNPNLGYIKMETDFYDTKDPNGVLKDFRYKDPTWGSVTSLKANSFELRVYFGDTHERYI